MPELLLQIQPRHQYYDDGVWHQLSLKPDKDTAAFLQRYRLLLLQTGQGIEVYYDGRGPFKGFLDALVDLLEGRSLQFFMHNSDAWYANISDLPLDWAGQLNYHSQDVSVSEDNPSQLRLNRQLAPRTVGVSGVIGQITINPVDLQHPQPPVFVIDMAARYTHWYYYVCNRSQRSYQQLSVFNDQGFVFESPESVALPTGEAALLFRSGTQVFALKQSVDDPFNLVHLMAGAKADSAINGLNSQALIEGLPIPQTNQLCIEQQNGQPYVYSPMYVYI